MLHSYADGKIEDTGPLTKKRMESVDDETVAAALDFIERQNATGTPWFVWWSGTRMHFRTHVSPENMASCKKQYPRADEYTCGMLEHVITSYSIHYTKLYDAWRGAAWRCTPACSTS